jgi:hypothetical protein
MRRPRKGEGQAGADIRSSGLIDDFGHAGGFTCGQALAPRIRGRGNAQLLHDISGGQPLVQFTDSDQVVGVDRKVVSSLRNAFGSAPPLVAARE